MSLEVKDRFDLALVRGTLHYIPPDRRVDVLTRLRQALRPAGVFVLLFNTGSRVLGELSSEGRRSYATCVIEELQYLDVPLPEEREAFTAYASTPKIGNAARVALLSPKTSTTCSRRQVSLCASPSRLA
jgi:SAM-dependent methyltransferase